MMKVIVAFFLFCIPTALVAQIDPELLIGINTATTAEISSIPTTDITEGALIYNSDLKSLLHFNNSSWITVSDEANKTEVTNELFFEDAPFFYISMAINTTSWVVVRYDRTDVNIEARANGTGTQPTTLTECTALTYL